MNKIKYKFLLKPLLIILLLVIVTGCGKSEKIDKIDIVCTIFPQYDWVRQILGDNIDEYNLILLSDKKTDLHNYQPTVENIANISACDLFIYVGGESDGWVSDVLKSAVNKNMVVINLLDVLGDAAKAEEITDGMIAEDGGDDLAYDEHVWQSVRNARIFCDVVANAIINLNQNNKENIQKNLNDYIEKLSEMNLKYQTAIDNSPNKTLLFADRFPFRYLTEDYNLKYYAVFDGCSSETEASFDAIMYFTQKVNELKLKYIIVTESSTQTIAKSIKNNSKDKNQKILVLDSMQSISINDVRDGVTYLSVLESNLLILTEALN